MTSYVTDAKKIYKHLADKLVPSAFEKASHCIFLFTKVFILLISKFGKFLKMLQFNHLIKKLLNIYSVVFNII